MPMKPTKVIESMRDELHSRCKDLSPADYKLVLEELEADMEGNLDALREENPELFS